MDFNRQRINNADNSVEVARYNKKMQSLVVYIVLFVLWCFAFIISGKSYLYFALSLIYVGVSWVRIKFIKGNREQSLKFFKISFLGYTAFMIMMSVLLKIATYDTNSTLSNAVNILNTMTLASSIIIPLGLIGVQANEIRHLFNGKNRTLQEDIDNIKDNVNKGM